MSPTAGELMVALFAVALFAATTTAFIEAESKPGAWVSAAAFFWFSLLAARLLWRLI